MNTITTEQPILNQEGVIPFAIQFAEISENPIMTLISHNPELFDDPTTVSTTRDHADAHSDEN